MTRFGIMPMSNRLRAAVAWLALVALLGHALLPSALMGTADMLIPGGGIKFPLCSADSESDAPGKTKPGLPVHHCALCTVSAAGLSRPQTGLASVCEVGCVVYSRLSTAWAAAPLRHLHVQARAPPTLA